MDKLVLDDDTKALVLAVRDLLKDLRARGLNDDQIDTLGHKAWRDKDQTGQMSSLPHARGQ